MKTAYAEILHLENKDPYYSVWLATSSVALRKAHNKNPEIMAENINKKLGIDSILKFVKELNVQANTLQAMHNARPEVKALLESVKASEKPLNKRRKGD